MNGTGTAAEDRGTRRPRALHAARRYSHFVSRNRWWVALGVVAVTAVALLPVPDLLGHITTNRGALQNRDEPARLRFDEVVRRFGTTFLNTAIIEGRDREAMRRAVDRIAATLTAPPPEGETPRDPCTDTRFAARQVRDVLYKVDLDEFERRGIYYLSAEDIEKLGEAFAAADTAPGRSAAPPLTGLQAMLDGVADGIETGTATPDSDDAGNAAAIDRLADAVERLRRWLDAPYPDERLGESAAPRLTEEDRRGVDEKGYVSEGTDPVLMFLFVRPVSDSEDEDVFRCFTRIVREAVREGVAAAGPGAGGIRALVTGMPALVSDDMDVIVADSSRVTMISGAAILALLLAYFRSIRTTAALFMPLLAGLAWTLGFTAVAVGRLTVITAYFGAILFGLGVDYAIQLLMRYDDEIRAGRVREEAWAQALANTGGGVLTGAATTALTFYAIGFTEFEGFAELGIIAGTGVVAIFTATAIVLPLLLFFVHRTRDRRVTLDLGMARLLRARPSRIAILIVAGIVVVVGFGSLARRVFDYDPIRLMARDAESVAGAEMLLGTDFSHETAIATAPTQAAAAELAAQLERLSKTTADPAGAGRACPDKPPTISRIESLDRYARFLPEMSRRKADAVDAIARHRELLVRMRSQAAAAAASPSPASAAGLPPPSPQPPSRAAHAPSQTSTRTRMPVPSRRSAVARGDSTMGAVPRKIGFPSRRRCRSPGGQVLQASFASGLALTRA
ncbi:MAG: MMPL family transporter, partial [Myxococcota bacterium]|nr:MMPL family transporter [Myxococcota bacterium]